MAGLSAVFSRLVPLRMLASFDMSKSVFMIPVLHSTFVWVRSVLLLVGSLLRIYTECCSFLQDIRCSWTAVVSSSVGVVSMLRVTFVWLISYGLRGRPQVVTTLSVLHNPPRSDIA